MAKHTLVAEVNFDDIILIGISCHHKIYKLCWALNNSLKFRFVKAQDYIVKNGNKENIFLKYEFEQHKTELRFSLIENRGIEILTDKKNGEKQTTKKSMLLFPEIKNIDYIMIIQGLVPESDVKALIHELKNVTFILAVFGIELENYKSKTNFLNFL